MSQTERKLFITQVEKILKRREGIGNFWNIQSADEKDTRNVA